MVKLLPAVGKVNLPTFRYPILPVRMAWMVVGHPEHGEPAPPMIVGAGVVVFDAV